ncbi:Cpn10-domain-containing protein [Thelephora ganbajun]|uniref:Cpn10-domain-containing protein n=1 Tax=Thelephora ganbajun TaxID=370292 RepID=A0ACB6ZLG6_THEGA|nr:Cpn10-domain-containing protein [Thelephora ganbajun]
MASQATFKSIKAVIPLLDRVLVQRFKPGTKTASGIFLPQSSTANPLPEATVIAVGPGALDKDGKIIPTTVKAGDKVLLPGWGGNSIKLGEEEYFLFRDSEILAKIQDIQVINGSRVRNDVCPRLGHTGTGYMIQSGL